MLTCYFENGGKASLRHVIIDTLVLKGNEILLVKRSKQILEGGKWAIVGGFVARDETIREAVAREVMEETGYAIKDITFLTVNDSPNRPHEDRQNIAFVFFAQALEKERKPDWESSEQKWFPLDALPKEEEIAFDHFYDINLYIDYKNTGKKLPVI